MVPIPADYSLKTRGDYTPATTESPKISPHSLKLLLEVSTVEFRS